MKKITLMLLLIFAATFMQAQDNLLTNGDFEAGMTVWEGNGFNVQEDGGNSFNFADVATPDPSRPFDVNLSQRGINISEGQTFTLTFDASTDAATGSRTLIAGIGLFVDPFTNQSEVVTITETTQTFSLELVANFSSADSRVLFDMNGAAGVIVIDNVILTLNEGSTGGGTPGMELLTNGDFEGGLDPWFGNANPEIRTEGGNSFFFANIETANAAMPFVVNLSQVVAITQGETYVLTFDASSDRTRNIIAGIGLNEPDFSNTSEMVAISTMTQTIELTLTATFGRANSRVLFDLAGAVGTVVIDNVSLRQIENGGGDTGTVTEPTVAAPTPPARNAADVFSIFSDAYTNQPDVVFGAFSVGTQDLTFLSIEGDNTLRAVTEQPAAEFVFADWGALVDNTVMTEFHMDYYISTDANVGVVANPKWSNHANGLDGGETSALELTNPANTFDEWVSVDVPLSTFGGSQQRDALRQFVLTISGAAPGTRTVFLDNIYLYRQATASNADDALANIQLFPNPSSSQWTIDAGDQSIESIQLYDVTGKQVSNTQVQSSTYRIDGTGLSTGFYMAKINTDSGSRTVKLIKE